MAAIGRPVPVPTDTPMFETLPAGEYDVIVLQAERKPIKSGCGDLLQLDCAVVCEDGRTGANLRDWLCLWHTKDSVAAGAINALGRVAMSCGIQPADLHDTVQLLNKRGRVKTIVKVDEKGYENARIEQWLPKTTPTATNSNTEASQDDVPF